MSDAIEAIIPPLRSRWSITPELARLLARLVLERDSRSVLEFGAGQSSLLLARALALRGGGRLTSVEHKPRHVLGAWEHVQAVAGVDAELVVSRLRRRWLAWRVVGSYIDAPPRLGARAPFDLVLIDGPPRRYGRYGTLVMAAPHLAPGASIVLDDAARREEQHALRRWLRRIPGLELERLDPEFGDRGVALLRYADAAPRAADPRRRTEQRQSELE